MFLPVVQFLHSFKLIIQAPLPLLGSSLETLKTHYVRLKTRDNSCQKGHLMAPSCFHAVKKACCKMHNWENLLLFLKYGLREALRLWYSPLSYFILKNKNTFSFLSWSCSRVLNVNNKCVWNNTDIEFSDDTYKNIKAFTQVWRHWSLLVPL